MTGQLVRFAVIGLLSTAVHLGLYVAFRGVLDPVPANLAALLITAVGNTAANRRLTFGVRGRAGTARHQALGLVVLGLSLLLTTVALTALTALAPGAGRAVEVAAIVVANGLATVGRFVAFRAWVFAPAGATRQKVPV